MKTLDNTDYDKLRQTLSVKTLDNTEYDNQVRQTVSFKTLDNTDYDNHVRQKVSVKTLDNADYKVIKYSANVILFIFSTIHEQQLWWGGKKNWWEQNIQFNMERTNNSKIVQLCLHYW